MTHHIIQHLIYSAKILKLISTIVNKHVNENLDNKWLHMQAIKIFFLFWIWKMMGLQMCTNKEYYHVIGTQLVPFENVWTILLGFLVLGRQLRHEGVLVRRHGVHRVYCSRSHRAAHLLGQRLVFRPFLVRSLLSPRDHLLKNTQ